ncbi:MAG: OadG-related small transporter subunit [Clostridium sp.]
MNEVFMQSLEIMVKGMGGIFVVMLIIFLAIKALTYFGKSNSED